VLLQPVEVFNQDEFAELNYFDKELSCRALLETGSTKGELDKLKVEFGPALPTATSTMVPVSCSGLSENTCKNTSGCKWVPAVVVPSYCSKELFCN